MSSSDAAPAPSPLSDEALLEQLAEDYTARLRRGESPDFDAYLTSAPHLEESIRALFPTIAALERKRSDDDAVVADVPDTLGDFQLVREVGRGGMGIVYEAVQSSLDRQVAVKVLLPNRVNDPKAIRRFEREAQTAARLHQTNIVPVLGFGSEQGRHFYVMQYIEGTTLDELIQRLNSTKSDQFVEIATDLFRPLSESISGSLSSSTKYDPSTWLSDTEDRRSDSNIENTLEPRRRQNPKRFTKKYLRSIAYIGSQIARALDYAHSQGVLHRDIKPANLILDQAGQVWVADFGLAKAIEHDSISRTGDIVGTVRYMAPEQLRGQATPQSDLYALGVTLYELLTLQPGHDIPAQKERLQSRITVELTPPRQKNPAISKELEAILLKAVAVNLDDRYQTARELADDLERFVERKTSPTRFLPSHPLAWLFPFALGLSAAVVFMVAFVMSRGNPPSPQKIETALQSSLDLLDRINRQFGPPGGHPGMPPEGEFAPPLSPLAKRVLSEEVSYLETLTERADDQPIMSAAVARAGRKMGEIRGRLGQSEAALDAFEQSIKAWKTLREEHSDWHLTLELARTYLSWGQVLERDGQSQQATDAFETALKTLDEIPANEQNNGEVERERERIRRNLNREGPPDDFRRPPFRDHQGPRHSRRP